MMRLIEAWVFLTMIARAAVYIPLGAFLGLLAFIVVWVSGGNRLGILLGLYVAYHAGNYIFMALAGFVGPPKVREPSVRGALRRNGMLGRR